MFTYPKQCGKILEYDFEYDVKQDSLMLGKYYIYCKGQWASIVKEEPLIIGGVEVEIVDKAAVINEIHYPKSFLESLLSTCRDFNEPITPELVTKIIDKLK